MTVVLPRLSRSDADRIIAAAAGSTSAELTARMPDLSADTTWPPVGDSRIGESALRQLRARLLDLARDQGMPMSTRGGGDFDGRAAAVLRDGLDLSPHEAAHPDAWSYLTCCWLLDIAHWRFSDSRDPRRYLGDINRNTFRRLWWRAEIIGHDVDLTLFGEDELVNIMERPTLTADRWLARTVAAEFLHAVDGTPTLPRQDLMRETTKRLLRRTPFIDFTSLDETELTAQVADMIAASAAALTGRPAPPSRHRTHRHRRAASDNVLVLDRVNVTGTADPAEPGPPTQRPEGATPPELTLDQAGAVAVDLASRTGRITNELLRQQLSIDADLARQILQHEVRLGNLVQRGQKRGTHYIVPDDHVPTIPEPSGVPDNLAPRSNLTVLRRLLGRGKRQ